MCSVRVSLLSIHRSDGRSAFVFVIGSGFLRSFRFSFTLLCVLTIGSSLNAQAASAAGKRPNVLIILIDDHPFNLADVDQQSPVHTPNIQRLAARGTWFSKGYVDAPSCGPSRTAMLTGVRSSRSGVYYNGQAYRRNNTFIAKATSLPGHFLKHGYLTAGYGKVAHNTYLMDDIGDYTPGYYKWMDNPKDVTHTNRDLLKFLIPGTLRQIPGKASTSWSWGILPDDWDRDDPTKLQQDTEQANRTIEVLGAKHEQPFFMFCGFYRPHIPWFAPKRYYDKFPLESIQLPPGYRADDLEDLPKPGRWIASNRGEHAEIVAAAMWKKCLQGIFASTAYVDEQIGRVLDALEKGPHRDNTIVVFAADNGFHTGEKNHWLKFALWEQTCRVVFSVSVPGMPVQRSQTPASLLDLFPTLISLCGLPPPETHTLDGVNLTDVLAGRARDRGQPVLTTYGRGNHSLRDDRFRFIRYRNGAEEFYDHQSDPYEWHNLAADPRFAGPKAALAKWLPQVDAPDIYVPPLMTPLKDASWADEAFEPDVNANRF
jgi:arylsulfatase A-like enzyme